MKLCPVCKSLMKVNEKELPDIILVEYRCKCGYSETLIKAKECAKLDNSRVVSIPRIRETNAKVSVLIATPIYRLDERYRKAVLNLDIEDIEIDIYYMLHNKYPKGYDAVGWQNNIPYKYDKARKVCLALGYDYLLTIEDDVIVPPETVRRLIELHKSGAGDIITGIYRLKPRDRGRLSSFCFKAIDNPYGGGKMTIAVQLKPNEDFDWGDVIDVDVISFGCTLIPRYVLEEIPLTVDVDFSRRCREKGFKLITDTGLICKHLDKDGSVMEVM